MNPSWRRWFRFLALGALVAALAVGVGAGAQAPGWAGSDPLTGPRSRLSDRKDWLGARALPETVDILLLAGHADSQNMAGSGTPGEAVALRGAAPMQSGMSDELYWNLLTARTVEALGRQRGLAMRFYDPPLRTIHNGDDPRTNWSVGRNHARSGGYALEIHYDAYGPDGVGSGLIPPLQRRPSRVDESLAQAFGAYPLHYRDGLGAPRRGIAMLEIGKLEGPLEVALRDPSRRQATLNAIASRVVDGIERGLGRLPVTPLEPAVAAGGGADPDLSDLSPAPGGARSVR
ncbi:dehydrogenase [Cyanobium sp. ATX 6A2]|uniref:dehydrogenase n=1 Tax=Cyanobium sp. ATX 6A2 TaxID=2823700 RepID=UPI0020CD6000|nr:dehydrogenase [Cyanobium sp. ATX 6A2]MCP9887944.1 dehydrogenase [Cyanobium sp. ATX 6A2]